MRLLKHNTQYGRYAIGPKPIKYKIPARTAWFFQELPAFVIPFYYLVLGCTANLANFLALLFITLHYAQRCFVYSLLIRNGKDTTIIIFIASFLVCLLNGYMQGAWHGQCDVSSYSSPGAFWIFIGVTIFVIGLLINLQSDSILRNLRKSSESGYKIPRGGMFEYVSAANYFGETIEWIGYAILSQSLPAFSFALITICNLVPRSISHHRWYQENLKDYPKNRKAFIPFIL